MDNPFLRKVAANARLSLDDRDSLQSLLTDVRQIKAQRTVIRQGETPRSVHLVLDGWLAREKNIRSGQRQITALFLPGDFCGLHTNLLNEVDYSIFTVTDATVAYINPRDIDDLTRSHSITRLFWWLTMLDEAVLRAWIVCLGQLSVEQRIAHLLCELHTRLTRAGQCIGVEFAMPLSQQHCGDIVGATGVHTNRVIQRLRSRGLVTWERGTVTINDLPALCQFADYDPRYLRSPRHGSIVDPR